jgi:hypothetical protein
MARFTWDHNKEGCSIPPLFLYKKIFTMTGHAMATETQSEAEAGMMARTSTTTRAMGGLRLRF